MLQQIIKDMFIDPDLLSELSDEQKQIIFLKIREEQVRRWKEREEKMAKEPLPSNGSRKLKPGIILKGTKTVNWLLGTDSNPWVWVMGEHADDKSVEQIIEDELKTKAKVNAEKEAEELRAKEEQELQKRLKEEELKLRLEANRQQAELAAAKKKAEAARLSELKKQAEEATETIINELKEKSEKARLNREESYRELKEKRTGEIMDSFKQTKSLWEQKAKENSEQLEKDWQLQELKAKKADLERRSLARSAREDVLKEKRPMTRSGKREVFRESAVLLGNVLTGIKIVSKADRSPRPSCTADVLKWFLEEEKPKRVGIMKDGSVYPWFHGIISREQSEALLEDKTVHSFLVRVSEKIWGYAISYKAEDKFKHYLVDITDSGGYQFFGTNQLEHDSLAELVNYHKNHHVSSIGQELLMFPVSQNKTPPDYAKLFPELIESTCL